MIKVFSVVFNNGDVMTLKSAFFLMVSTAFILPINVNAKEYSCYWEASRSMSSPDWTAMNSPLPIQGVVKITDDMVTYGSVKFVRDRSVPVQKRSNGSTSVVYRDGKKMFQAGYSPDGQVLISLMLEDNFQTAGKCR